MTYSSNRIVVIATRAPGSLAAPLPPHSGFVIVRSHSPIWIRFGTADMGQAARDGGSVFHTGGEHIHLVPKGATHFRTLAEYVRAHVQLEAFTQATPPDPEPPDPVFGAYWTPNKFDGVPIVPGGAGWAMGTDACFGRDEASGGLGRVFKNYPVTNLNLDGPGSFKAAVEASGPRVVTFWVSGVIDYHKAGDDNREIIIGSGDLYVAGETAPFPGIVVYGAKLIIDVVTAPDTVLSNFGMFQYPYDDIEKQDSRGDVVGHRVPDGQSRSNSNILHASMCYGWGLDETQDANNGVHGITFYQCAFAEGLMTDRNVSNVGHAYGALLAHARQDCKGEYNRCVFIHNKERNPLTRAQWASITNCLWYDCWNRCISLEGWKGHATQTNIEGNLFVDGPEGKKDAIFRSTGAGEDNTYTDNCSFYMGGNKGLGYDESKLLSDGGGTKTSSRISAAYPPGVVVTTIEDREEFARLVARHVGPWPGKRQSVIERFMNHIEARLTGAGDKGGAVVLPEDIGGMPPLEVNEVDHARGDDPMPGVTSSDIANVGEAGREIMPSGVTAFEEWLDRRRAAIQPADAARVDDEEARYIRKHRGDFHAREVRGHP